MTLPKAYLFDVFGTVVNWRLSLTQGLEKHAADAIRAGSADAAVLKAASQMTSTHWEAFTVEWHGMYIRFSAGFMPGVSTWVDNDEVHLRSLHVLLRKHRLEGLWDGAQLHAVNMLWHALEAWPDSADGMAALNEVGVTSTLSNGSRPLLSALAEANRIPFNKILCSDDFLAYKPAPEVYLGAVEKVLDEAAATKPGEVAMVAAHLQDLEAAKALGLRTIYIARPLEEAYPAEHVRALKAKGNHVDMWVEDGEGGIVEVARRLKAAKTANSSIFS